MSSPLLVLNLIIILINDRLELKQNINQKRILELKQNVNQKRIPRS